MPRNAGFTSAALAALVLSGPIALAQESTPTTSVPDGYLIVEAPPDWQGQTTDWYREQAKGIYQQMMSESGVAPTGIAIVDRDTGEIVATFDVAALTAP